MPARLVSRIPAALLATLCLYALIIIVTRIFFTSPGYDDSYYGGIVRNLAEGRGYVFSYGETAVKFDPVTSVGPATLLPAGLVHWIFGSPYWANGLTLLLISLPLLLLIGWVLHRRYGVPLIGLAGLLVVVLIFSNERAEDGDIFRFLFLWSHLMGEVPAILFTMGAATLSAAGYRKPAMYSAAGVLLSLALYSKVFVILTLPAFAVLYAWLFWRNRDPWPPIAFAGGMALVALPIELGKVIYLGGIEEWRENLAAVKHHYGTWNAGTGDQSSVRKLATQLSISIGVFPLAAWAGIVAFDWVRRRSWNATTARALLLAVVLLLAAAIHMYWWTFMNDAGWMRHAIPGLMYLAVALTLLASHVRLQITRYATFAAVAIIVVTQADAVTDYRPIIERESRLESLLSTSDYLNEIEDEGVSFWGCGWWSNRDLDFVGDVNFYDCLDRSSVWKHLDAGEQTLLVRSEFFNWENSPVLASIAEDCDRRMLFADGPFAVCDATPWLRANTPRPGS